MSNEMFTQLPTVTTAQFSDITTAVQGYSNPAVPGTSVQETWGQVYTLFTTLIGNNLTSVISSGSPITLTSTVIANLTSLSLTTGTWNVYGNVSISGTNITKGQVWISTTSVTLPDASLYNSVEPLATSSVLGLNAPSQVIVVASPGPQLIYLSVEASFTAATACGGLYAIQVK